MAGLILYNNLVRTATVVSEATATNFAIANALDGRTATQAGFEAAANRDVIFDLTTAQSIDCIGIARHNFNDLSSVTFSVSGSTDNVTYNTMSGDLTVSDGNVFIDTFASASYRYIRLRVNPTGGTAYVSDVFIGAKLDLERSQKHGFIKPDYADNDTVIENVTRGQNLAGLTLQQNVKSVKFDLYYYSAAFFSDWSTIVSCMKTYPVYIRWDTTETPFYCWPKKAIPKPAYSKNITGYYTVRLDMNGITE